jgi:stage V sporulation protein S
MTLIKVAFSSDVAAVAGAIAGMARENQRTEIQVVGAPAINQAVKAIALANEYLREDRILVAFVPEFVNVVIQDR